MFNVIESTFNFIYLWSLQNSYFWAYGIKNSVNEFGRYICYLGCVVGLMVFFISYDKFRLTKKWFALGYLCFLSIVFALTQTNNLFYFFIFYEFLFFPSFLLVFFLAPNRRGVFASYYFFFWTQGGSLMVLIAFLYVYYVHNVTFFSDFSYTFFNHWEKELTLFFLFCGFGIKFPIFPFHYWLTKTHVEAPTFFSIYLSGFLVKTALYGFYLVYIYYPFTYTSLAAVGVLTFGVLDSTLKMWGQSDLKKLVAYGTVQEMNLIGVLLILGGGEATSMCVLFCLTHTLLSAIFFFFVDVIYRRYKTRNIQSLGGLWFTSPQIAINLIFGVVLYTGLPFTLKFFVELSVLCALLNYSIFFFLLSLLVLNFLGSVIWIKTWFGVLFGTPSVSTLIAKTLTLADQLFLTILYTHLVVGIFLI